MGILNAVKNFFYDEEPEPRKSGKYDHDDTPLVNACDLFPVHVLSNPDAMREVLQRREVQAEIEKKVQADFKACMAENRARLDQPQPKPKPEPVPEEAKPDWLKGVDDKL